MTVAALFVDPKGPYAHLAECWGVNRDARRYAGELPVVAHPPCATWGRMFWATGLDRGDDDGCANAAVATISRVGGVLEHPEQTYLWKAFDLPRPTGVEGV